MPTTNKRVHVRAHDRAWPTPQRMRKFFITEDDTVIRFVHARNEDQVSLSRAIHIKSDAYYQVWPLTPDNLALHTKFHPSLKWETI